MKTGIILAIIVVLALMSGCGTYNGFNAQEQKVNSKWAQVENQYQRRFDLVPNLVQVVQGAAQFEKDTFVEVSKARASVGQLTIQQGQAPATALELEKFQKAQGQLSSALSRLMVVAEKYPDLKATAGFRDLQAQLEGTENRISTARRDFNEAAQEYNTAIKHLPGRLVASLAGFQPKPYFTAQQGAEQAPKVQFNFNPNR